MSSHIQITYIAFDVVRLFFLFFFLTTSLPINKVPLSLISHLSLSLISTIKSGMQIRYIYPSKKPPIPIPYLSFFQSPSPSPSLKNRSNYLISSHPISPNKPKEILYKRSTEAGSFFARHEDSSVSRDGGGLFSAWN